MGLKPDKRAKGNWKTVALPLAIFAAELWSCLTKLSISQCSISLFHMILWFLVVTSVSQLHALCEYRYIDMDICPPLDEKLFYDIFLYCFPQLLHIIISSRKINGRMIWFRMKPHTFVIVLTALSTTLMILGKSNSHLIHKLIIYRSYYDYVVAK